MYMYFEDYMGFMIAIVICLIFSIIASVKVHSAFSKYDGVPNRTGMSGADTASRLLRSKGVNDIAIGKVRGELSDHYNPKKEVVNLSDSTYDSRSIASVAVAAHEIGHVMQNKEGYFLYRIRTAIVPIVNIGSYLAIPLVMIGVLLDVFSMVAGPDVGFYIALVGVALYGGSLLFALVTLPVELNASKRAKEMLIETGVLQDDEIDGASEVLSAAALTYIASLLTSLVYFLRFLVQVLTIFGRRDGD